MFGVSGELITYVCRNSRKICEHCIKINRRVFLRVAAIWCLLPGRKFSLFGLCLCVMAALSDSLTGLSLVSVFLDCSL